MKLKKTLVDRSKNKLLHHTPYVDLYQSEKGFFYCQRKNVNSIAALCFRYNHDASVDFLVHYQQMPQIAEKIYSTDFYPCPITGGFDGNELPIECAVREVYEEGGLKINETNFVAMTKTVVSTQMNEQVFHFLFDVTGIVEEKPKTDGSYFEQFAENKWTSVKEIKNIIFNESNVKLSSLHVCYLLWLKYNENKNNK